MTEFRPRPYCPRCGARMPYIQYGLPTPEALEEAEHSDDIILGGCIVGEGTYHCTKCGLELDENMRVVWPDHYIASSDIISAPGVQDNDGVIVLTSCGFDAVREKKFYAAYHMAAGNPREERVLYVTTAADGEDGDKSWMDEEETRMWMFGFRPESITEYKIGDELNADDFDVMYLMGGNSYYLLDIIRKHNFDKVIRKFLEDGKVVIGSSAGSQVLGMSVKVSADENKIGMTDFTGLGLVDALIIPHANKNREFVNEWREKTDERIIALTDYAGIVVTNRDYRK